MSENEDPKHGYGKGGRPLWNVRDRDAEAIREVLRNAGRQEFSDDHDGFAVEGGHGDEPFMVACTDDPEAATHELPQYEAALLKAGYRVKPEPDDDQTLQAWPPS